MDIVTPVIERYAHEHTRSEPELLCELAEETRRTRSDHGMLTGRLEGRLLKLLVQLVQARRVLELGLFTGYSALSMAEGLAPGGELISCDIDPRAEQFALRYLARSPHGSKVTIRIGPALETMASLNGPFDLVFIDADKENYVEYLQWAIRLTWTGSVIVLDNVIRDGKILEPESDDPGSRQRARRWS